MGASLLGWILCWVLGGTDGNEDHGVGVTETGEETWMAAGSRVGMEEHGASHLLTE